MTQITQKFRVKFRLGHEYDRLPWCVLHEPSAISWANAIGSVPNHQVCFIAGVAVANMEPRPHYCDRGRVWVHCMLPDIDWQDGFPRYYMSEATAKQEIEAFMRWRLWRERAL